MSSLPFRSLFLELSSLTAEGRIDTSEEEGCSSITTMKPSLSISTAMMGRFSYPFKTCSLLDDPYVRSVWSGTHRSLGKCAIKKIIVVIPWDFCIEIK